MNAPIVARDPVQPLHHFQVGKKTCLISKRRSPASKLRLMTRKEASNWKKQLRNITFRLVWSNNVVLNRLLLLNKAQVTKHCYFILDHGLSRDGIDSAHMYLDGKANFGFEMNPHSFTFCDSLGCVDLDSERKDTHGTSGRKGPL